MSTKCIHRGQAIRIAIALTVLKHKPETESFQSYMIDLQEHFPTESSSRQGTSQQLIVKTPAEPWRDRALSLEHDLQQLQEKYRSEHAELLALRATVKETETPAVEPTSNKKKQKIKPSANSKRPPIGPTAHKAKVTAKKTQNDILRSARTKLPDVFRSGGVFNSLQTLELIVGQLSAQPTSASPKRTAVPYVSVDLLLSTTQRVLDSVSSLLLNVLPQPYVHPKLSRGSSTPDLGSKAASDSAPWTGNDTSQAGNLSATKILETVPELLEQILPAVLPLLFSDSLSSNSQSKSGCSTATRRDNIDVFLGYLMQSILLPLLRSFAGLSDDFVASLFANDDGPSPHKRQKTSSSSSKKNQRHAATDRDSNSHPSIRSHTGSTTDLRPLVSSCLKTITSVVADEFRRLADDSELEVGTNDVSWIIKSFFKVLILESTREIGRIYGIDQDNEDTRDERMSDLSSSSSSISSRGNISNMKSNTTHSTTTQIVSIARLHASSVLSSSSSSTTKTHGDSLPAPNAYPNLSSDLSSSTTTTSKLKSIPDQNMNFGKIDPTIPTPVSGPLKKLARKDTLWYLCDFMNLMIALQTTVNSENSSSKLIPGSDASSGENEEMILLGDEVYLRLSELFRGSMGMDAISDGYSEREVREGRRGSSMTSRDHDLVTSKDGKKEWDNDRMTEKRTMKRGRSENEMDEVESGMLMAFLEKSWFED
ncbi:hypothetical protein ABKN59_003236 [Abortiporus biennis]